MPGQMELIQFIGLMFAVGFWSYKIVYKILKKAWKNIEFDIRFKKK